VLIIQPVNLLPRLHFQNIGHNAGRSDSHRFRLGSDGFKFNLCLQLAPAPAEPAAAYAYAGAIPGPLIRGTWFQVG